MTDIAPKSPTDKTELFREFCWARAQSYALGFYGLQEAVDGCLPVAKRLGLTDMDAVQAIMAAAFREVRDDL